MQGRWEQRQWPDSDFNGEFDGIYGGWLGGGEKHSPGSRFSDVSERERLACSLSSFRSARIDVPAPRQPSKAGRNQEGQEWLEPREALWKSGTERMSHRRGAISISLQPGRLASVGQPSFDTTIAPLCSPRHRVRYRYLGLSVRRLVCSVAVAANPMPYGPL